MHAAHRSVKVVTASLHGNCKITCGDPRSDPRLNQTSILGRK